MGNSSYPKAAILKLKTSVTSGDLNQLREILTECENTVEHGATEGGRSGRTTAAETPSGESIDSCTECTAVSINHMACTRRCSRTSKKAWLLAQALNKKGEAALSLSARCGHSHIMKYLLDNGAQVNGINKDGDTALDIVLGRVMPGEGDILHNHFCPYSHATESRFKIPDEAKTLIRHGGKGSSLHKLILNGMNDPQLLKEISELIPNLQSDDNYRLSGLLLQVAVWFERIDIVVDLLEKGVDPENFWRAPFIPTIVPNTEYRRTVDMWESMSNETEGDYVVSCPDKVQSVDSSAGLQSLKLSFVQDWRADWYDGENPDAQYRAGLLLTIDGAIIMTKSANNENILCHVLDDIMHYLPPICGGPHLRDSPVIPLLISAGYQFTQDEIVQLTLKYDMDFSEYLASDKQPKTLKQLSRLCIRFSLSHNTFMCVPSLHCLPTELRNYLFLDEVK